MSSSISPSSMALITSLFPDVKQQERLVEIISSGKELMVYDVVEPNGSIHLPQAFLKAHIIKSLAEIGLNIVLYIADWLAFISKKLGGDMDAISTIGKYYIEVFKSLGVPFGEKVRIVWMKEAVGQCPDYYEQMIDFSQIFLVSQLKTISQEMEKLKDTNVYASHVMGPCLFCANTFFLGQPTSQSPSSSPSSSPTSPSSASLVSKRPADIIQVGTDMMPMIDLLLSYCSKKDIPAPLVLNQPMIRSLAPNAAPLMTKRVPQSTIFIEDAESSIRKKISKAFLPTDLKDESGLRDIVTHIILPIVGSFTYCGITVKSWEEINIPPPSEDDKDSTEPKPTLSGLKSAIADSIITLLEPIHRHFGPEGTPENQVLHSQAMLILYPPPKPAGQKKAKKAKK